MYSQRCLSSTWFVRGVLAEEQRLRVFIVHKVTERVARRLLSALSHSDAVIGLVFDHPNALAPQKVLLPLPCVRGHMHRDAEAEPCAHDADGEAEVAGGADRDGIAGKERAEGIRGKKGIVVAGVQAAVLQRDVLGGFQHLINAAARLDGAGDGQVVVLFEPELPTQRHTLVPLERALHRRNADHVRFDDAACAGRFGKCEL